MGDVPRLRLSHAKQFFKIAMKARSSPIPRADRRHFVALIFEGAQEFTSRPLSPKDRRRAILSAASDARSLAKNLGSLLASEEPLFEASSFAKTVDLQHQLIALAKHYELRAPPPQIGRPPDRHFMLLVSWLDDAWQLAVGRPGGTTWYPDKEIRGGPFVDFVGAVLSWLEPTARSRKALGESVQSALATMRKWREGETI